jgi:hypothetical protein
MSTPIPFVRHDGGRAAAGFKGKTQDCVTRAIAIVRRSGQRCALLAVQDANGSQ